jgi:hypothetical protein
MAERRDRSWVAAVLLGVVILLLLASAAVLIPRHFEPPSHSGEFGDMFGGVNALFSGLAFVGVIYAILLQRRELQYQREELEQTRYELKGQREQLEAQNRTFRRQTFDNAFFHLLELHHQIVNGMDLGESSADAEATTTGRDCFVQFYRNLRERLESDERFEAAGATRENIRIAYAELYDEIQPEIGHYFRNLYNIVKFIDRSEVEDKKTYSNLVRAQLSSHELLMLFYNCLTRLGEEKFKPLLERYALLKNMPEEALLDESHVRWYDSGAFRSGEASADMPT